MKYTMRYFELDRSKDSFRTQSKKPACIFHADGHILYSTLQRLLQEYLSYGFIGGIQDIDAAIGPNAHIGH